MATGAFDIFDLLRQDHQRVTQVIENIERSEHPERENFILLLNDEFIEHMTLEEDFFYNSMEDFEELGDAIRQSYGEHEQMRALLEDVMELDSESPEWQAAFIGLKETKDDHMVMEEREIFPLAARVVPEEELLRLSEQISRQKKRVAYKEPTKRTPAERPPRAGL